MWLLGAVSTAPGLPKCLCDWQHRSSIALEDYFSHPEIQMPFQSCILSSSLALLGLFVRTGSLTVFANVPALVPKLPLLDFIFSHSLFCSCFFPPLSFCPHYLWYLYGVLTHSSAQLLCNSVFLSEV